MARKINKKEFVHYCSDGEKYWPLVEYAEVFATSKDKYIGLRFEKPFSSYEETWIRWFIGRKDNESTNNILYSASKAISHLYHELGHVMQPPIKKGDPESIAGSAEQIKREEEAWAIGRALLKNSRISIDNEFWRVFEEELSRCLNSYKARANKCKDNCEP